MRSRAGSFLDPFVRERRPVTATATIRPGAVSWRSGFDDHRHAVASVRPARAACGARIRGERFDRPDHPRCLDCLEVVGIDVSARVAR